MFGTSKDITLGPTAILSLLTASLTWGCGPSEDPNDTTSRIKCAIALTFLSGAIQFAVGLLNLGKCLPYSQKYWWSFNLVVQPQTLNIKILAKFKFGSGPSQGRITITQEDWPNLIWQFKHQLSNHQVYFSANISGFTVYCTCLAYKLLPCNLTKHSQQTSAACFLRRLT